MKKDDLVKKLSDIKKDVKIPKKVEDTAHGLLEKAKDRVASAASQSKDGKFDLSNLSQRWNEKKDQGRREADAKQLRPIFEEDLASSEFNLPKMIRIMDPDIKHTDSDVCTGSIAHESDYSGLRVVNIYPQNLHFFGLSFYPDTDDNVYYVDPVNRGRYIALDEYFSFLKVARISELQKIAQDLGAKHFRVIYKEYSDSSSKRQSILKGNIRVVPGGAQINAEQYANSHSTSKVEIAAEMTCLGHEPVEPTLVYFKRDPQIQSLVALRMSDNAMTHQTYTLKMSNTSGIKSKDAASIDAAVTSMKANINVSIEKEAESENNRYFEYEIDF